MADNILARIGNLVAIPSLNFITWAQFRAAGVYIRFQILYILHIGFTITSNGKSVEVVVPTLLAFMQVKNIGIDGGPFVAHSTTMSMAIISFLIYAFLAYGMNLRSQNLRDNPPPYPFHCMVFFGNTTVASLASIFFPDSIGPALYVLCVLISAGELLYRVYEREEHNFMRHIRRFFNTLKRLLFNYFPMEQRDILAI
ncbi:Hypothetical predicted protein [Olea europaea subsp. europaea]|uniref:Uncharacterized protein n=1 Tax=Olea europaea subsp. europaea TaxID=158383 RepID=A0A8S0U0D1_OLEEU|nr:Hypothetical predicted protein [Olea europaea subsp. europaea]CAA3010668.1 Hypothetical predicted protein [Olea europaea subsp. europaea]